MALQNQTTSTTKLDIPTAHRHDVLSSKQVIIGCGGGFRHECANRQSPVAQWMAEVDLALHDESQQYGNLDETAAIARLPRNCLVLWLGDHRQNSGRSSQIYGCQTISTEAVEEACSSFKRKLGQGPTKHLISGGSEVPHWYPPLPCLPSGPVDETRSTPPTKCAGTDRDPCQRTTWYICVLADGYCPPHCS